MPPPLPQKQKQQKETVVYPASKRKAPPFKPQRPSKVPRIPTTDSESAVRLKPTGPSRQTQVIRVEDDEEDEEDASSVTIGAGAEKSDSDDDEDEELEDNPLAAKPRPAEKAGKSSRPPTVTKQKQHPKRAISSSPLSLSPPRASNPHTSVTQASPTQLFDTDIDTTPTIPQPLLIRLLHERFADKKTKIDRHAVQVVQRYFEVFVREAVARARAGRREDVDGDGDANGGGVVDKDGSWLELGDLEKVAAGMVLDF